MGLGRAIMPLAALGLGVVGLAVLVVSRSLSSASASAPDAPLAPPCEDEAFARGPASHGRAFLLLVAIDQYKYAGSSSLYNLRGCVSDARDIRDYFVNALRIPHHNIIKLYNADATRANILAAIDRVKASSIRPDDAIIIFWAGHGTRVASKRPSRGRIELLVPHDFNPLSEDKEGLGIPDYLLGSKIAELAEVMGDNITIIVDACHAGSSTRATGDCLVRGFDLSQGDSNDLVAAEVGTRGLGPDMETGWGGSSASHVLLAATSRLSAAWEEDGRGVFTRALVRDFRTHGHSGRTYSDLMAKLSPLHHRFGPQYPQCEGKHAGRYLFDTCTPTSGYRFHLRDEYIIIAAGRSQGVNEFAFFDLYADRAHTQPWMYDVKPHQLGTEETRCYFPRHGGQSRVQLLMKGWAVQTSSGACLRGPSSVIVVPLAFSSRWRGTLRQIAEQLDKHPHTGLRLRVPGCDRSQLVLSRNSDGNLAFDLTDKLCRHNGLQRLRHTVQLGASAHMALAATAEFFHHLRRPGPGHLRAYLQVKAYRLKPHRGEMAPFGNDLLKDGIMIPEYVYERGQGNNESYGFSITNRYRQPLYIWIFGFNMNDLSIDEIYRPVLANTGADCCIREGGTLNIGYGDGGVDPLAFFLSRGEEVGVTYLKIFASTSRFDLECISQHSPFSSGRPLGKADYSLPAEWDAFELPLILILRARTQRNM